MSVVCDMSKYSINDVRDMLGAQNMSDKELTDILLLVKNKDRELAGSEPQLTHNKVTPKVIEDQVLAYVSGHLKKVSDGSELIIDHILKLYEPHKPMITLEKELEEILDSHAEYYIHETMKFFQRTGESPALSKDNEGDVKSRTQILNLINRAENSARLDEIGRYELAMTSSDCEQIIMDRVAQLKGESK